MDILSFENNDAKMAVVARSEETANKILAEGKNVLLCTDNDVSLLDIASVKKIHLMLI